MFTRAFTETTLVRRELAGQPGKFEERHVTLEDSLVEQILTCTIDVGLLRTLLTYYVGRPAQQADPTATARIPLERLITGQGLEGEDETPDTPLAPPAADGQVH